MSIPKLELAVAAGAGECFVFSHRQVFLFRLLHAHAGALILQLYAGK